MKIKAILFDLDGTLVDTSEFIYQAYEYTLSFHKFKVIKREHLAPHIGRGLSVIYREIAPGGDIEALMKTHNNFQSKNFHLVKSFPDILKVIEKLRKKGLRTGIVTSRHKNTPKTLQAAGIRKELFDVIIAAENVTNLKPHPEGVLLALNKLNLKPEDVILVGDAKVDIEMGQNAKVKTVGVTYGFGGKEIAKSNPDFVIDRLEELLGIII